MYTYGHMYLINRFRFGGGAAPVDPDFTMLVKTDNSGTSASDQFLIKTISGGYNYDVDWGDGNTDTGVTGDITHTYASAGTYTVKISGLFPRLYSFGSTDVNKILDVLNWGTIAWGNDLTFMLYNADSLTTLSATDTPDFSSTTVLNGFFRNANNFVGGGNIENWDVSNISNFQSVFEGTKFNADISGWDVSSATNFSRMFIGANQFNQDISVWNVSSVTNMGGMLNGASSFNQDISGWDVSNVTIMVTMFFNASSFNQDISSWNVSSVTNMNNMFRSASSFNQNLASWQLDSVSDLRFVFANSGMSTANYTDTIVGWANYVFTNGAPYNVNMSSQNGMTFDTSRSGGANFADAGAARTYLTTTAGWTISGDTVI